MVMITMEKGEVREDTGMKTAAGGDEGMKADGEVERGIMHAERDSEPVINIRQHHLSVTGLLNKNRSQLLRTS